VPVQSQSLRFLRLVSVTLKYFAYGSNLHPGRLRRRAPSCQVLAPACLSGHRLAFNKRGADASGKANILRHAYSGAEVYGAIFLIDRVDKGALDRAEGGYRVEHHLVQSGAVRHQVFTYVARDEFLDESLTPYHWYHQMVMAGARYHRLPGVYLQSLQAVPTMQDEDADRARRNEDLLRDLQQPTG